MLMTLPPLLHPYLALFYSSNPAACYLILGLYGISSLAGTWVLPERGSWTSSGLLPRSIFTYPTVVERLDVCNWVGKGGLFISQYSVKRCLMT
jgi:hypothetical protein